MIEGGGIRILFHFLSCIEIPYQRPVITQVDLTSAPEFLPVAFLNQWCVTGPPVIVLYDFSMRFAGLWIRDFSNHPARVPRRMTPATAAATATATVYWRLMPWGTSVHAAPLQTSSVFGSTRQSSTRK